MTRRQSHDKTTVICSECGKPIPSIPSWLATVDVKFECEECRQKAAGRPVGALMDLTSADEPDTLPELEGLDEDLAGAEDEDVEPEDLDLEEPILDDEIDAESDARD